MKFLLFFITVLVPLLLIYYSYKIIDHKNKEPKRAILLALVFSVIIFFIEFFLVKPSIGKFLAFFDPYHFVYFITEERGFLNSLTRTQNMVVILLSSFSKAVVYSIGLKVLYTNLKRLGRWKWYAGKHNNDLFGFLDEPIDYIIYSIIFFVVLAFCENLIHFRFDSTTLIDRMSLFLLLFAYFTFSIIIGFIWLKKIVKFGNGILGSVFLKVFFQSTRQPKNKTYWGLITSTELRCMLWLFVLFILFKIPFMFNSILIESLCLILVLVTSLFFFKQSLILNRKTYAPVKA